jgi:hypothetical protein
MLKAEAGNFVNIVASVDRVEGSGRILYVNPVSIATITDTVAGASGPPQSTPFDVFELSIRDDADKEFLRFHPTIQLAACESGPPPETGIVNQDVPVLEGMHTIVLLHKGVEVARFEAGASLTLTNAAGMTPMSAGAQNAAKPNRYSLETAIAIGPEAGVTYTVQVRPSGKSSWQTIAVGRATPEVELHRNQFPGAATATVRILRSTGFEDEVIAEQELNLNL